MSQCVFQYLISEERCKRPALPDPRAQGYCILHAPLDDKDLNAFQAVIDEIIRDAPNNQNTCDFSGCYFPRGYDCKELQKALQFNCFFVDAQFSGEADFRGARFFGKADFTRAQFFQEANFMGAQFFEETDFGRANFSREADFWLASFSQLVDFSYCECNKNAVIDFTDVDCLKPQQVQFHHVDLSRWSFLNTDLRRIDFDDVTWGIIPSYRSALQWRQWVRRWEKRHLPRRWLLQLLRLHLRLTPRRTSIFDEIRVSDKKDDLARVERLYRHLKQNYENQRDYSRAGDFYYGEMEMKRRQLNALGQIPFWLYRIMSGYGESYVRALIVLILMWVAFALLFTVAGYTELTTNNSSPSFLKSLIYSAQSMTLFHEPTITFHSVWGQAVELIASVLGVIQIALFGLALQRRFKR